MLCLKFQFGGRAWARGQCVHSAVQIVTQVKTARYRFYCASTSNLAGGHGPAANACTVQCRSLCLPPGVVLCAANQNGRLPGAIAPLLVAVAAICSSEPIAVTDEECGRKPFEMQNVTDLLRIFSLGTILPNRSDTLNIESDCHPHSCDSPRAGLRPVARLHSAAALVIRPA